ncbi:MAG: SpoIIE family protein phosphatase [Planctomycetes bacterium]|nr:SpoIIE family protein phosphatase [Planctomycetota bacterium]
MFSWRGKKSAPESKDPKKTPAAAAVGAAAGTPDADSASRFLTGNSDVDRRTVEVLLKTIARVSESSDDETLLEHIVDNSVELCGAERGFLILATESGETRVHVARTRDKKSISDNVRFSTSVVKRVLESGEPMLATVQSDAEAIEIGRSVFDLKLRAVMCVPLTKDRGTKGGARGALYVDSRAATREFTHRELDLFAALSQHIAITLEKRRLHLESIEKARLEQQMELAKAVQSGLMPRIPKDIGGLDIHGFYRPAERTSGDFFDFVKLKDGRLAVVVGDVSGHGVGPALITQSAQGVLRTGLRMSARPSDALTMLNQDLSERIDAGTFLTLLLLSIATDGRVEICNAGHHGPIVARGAQILIAEQHSLALGFSADVEYGVDDVLELKSGDVLLAFTDGLIEAHSMTDREQLFGEERVKALLAEHAQRGSSAETITLALAEAAFQFAGGKHEDDITLVVIRKV